MFDRNIETKQSDFSKDLDMDISNTIIKFHIISWRIEASQTRLLTFTYKGLFGSDLVHFF